MSLRKHQKRLDHLFSEIIDTAPLPNSSQCNGPETLPNKAQPNNLPPQSDQDGEVIPSLPGPCPAITPANPPTKNGALMQKLSFLSFSNMFTSKVLLTRSLALIYLGAITLAELLTTVINPLPGLVLHGLVLLALLLQASLTDSLQTRRFLLALSLAPLTRLISLVMPLQDFLPVYWYLLVGAPLLMAAIVAARVGGFSRVDLGLTFRKLPLQALIALTGIGLGYLENRILRPQPLVADLRLELIWFPALILLIFTGLLEEFVFRGLMQHAAKQSLGSVGMTYVAVVFAVMHIGYRSVLDVLFVFAVAIFFGWLVQRTGSILGVTLAHGLTNIGLFLVFPFLLVPQSPPQAISPAIEPAAEVMLERTPAFPIQWSGEYPSDFFRQPFALAAPDLFSGAGQEEVDFYINPLIPATGVNSLKSPTRCVTNLLNLTYTDV